MANYDQKPPVLEAVGNGSYLYRFNITQAQVSEEPGLTRQQWNCDEVTVWAPLSANKITAAVIAQICPASHEQKLVNEYNAATLGMLGGSETSGEARASIEAYKQFLQLRQSAKAQVNTDCAALGIK